MRVKANKELTFYYELVPYTVPAGTELDGVVAQHLVTTNADVTVLEEDQVAEADGGAETVAVQGSELDISAKIDDVLAWVGADPDRALEAHAAEETKGDKARTRLLARLEEIATGDQEPAEDGPAGSDD